MMNSTLLPASIACFSSSIQMKNTRYNSNCAEDITPEQAFQDITNSLQEAGLIGREESIQYGLNTISPEGLEPVDIMVSHNGQGYTTVYTPYSALKNDPIYQAMQTLGLVDVKSDVKYRIKKCDSDEKSLLSQVFTLNFLNDTGRDGTDFYCVSCEHHRQPGQVINQYFDNQGSLLSVEKLKDWAANFLSERLGRK